MRFLHLPRDHETERSRDFEAWSTHRKFLLSQVLCVISTAEVQIKVLYLSRDYVIQRSCNLVCVVYQP